MSIFHDAVVMIQYFPDSGEYIVHREGAVVEIYGSDDEIQDSRINRFLRECLAGKNYHECTIHPTANRASGTKVNPARQIIYCKSFDSEVQKAGNVATSNINWVLWEPNKFELTVNRGTLAVSKKAQVKSLADAPADIREFMEACTDGEHIALSHHYSEPVREDGDLKMVNISEYFFSTSKVIYGFQHERVAAITADEMASIGLKHL